MIGRVHHVGIAVRSLREALPRFRSLGMPAEEAEEVRNAGVRVCFLGSGETRVELLEPLGPESPVARFLEKRGEGLHHVAFETEDIATELERLESAGFDLIDRVPRPGAHGRLVAFVQPRSVHGVLVELVQEPREVGTAQRT